VRFSFSVGGKDGVPYPADRKGMGRTVECLERGVAEAKIKKREKLEAVQRLQSLIPPDEER